MEGPPGELPVRGMLRRPAAVHLRVPPVSHFGLPPMPVQSSLMHMRGATGRDNETLVFEDPRQFLSFFLFEVAFFLRETQDLRF